MSLNINTDYWLATLGTCGKLIWQVDLKISRIPRLTYHEIELLRYPNLI